MNIERVIGIPIEKLVNMDVKEERSWIEKRNMPAAKIGRLWKFKVSEVDAWMKSGVAADK